MCCLNGFGDDEIPDEMPQPCRAQWAPEQVQTILVVRCRPSDVCKGGEPVRPDHAIYTAQCREGHLGFACGTCQEVSGETLTTNH